MNSKSTYFKNCITVIGFILLFSLPILGIGMVWGFDMSNTSEGIKSLFVSNTTKSADTFNYNFTVEPGEDAILTTIVKDESQKVVVKPRSNPAVLVKIDSASIEGSVVYGSDGEERLTEGFWHFPASVFPGEQGVSAIFGHRRYHLPPAKDTFYNLDKVQKGDRVEIKLLDGTWLEYTVISTEVINPDQLQAVLNTQTDEYLVKFITCTPLGTDHQRLIVTAKKTF